jgi:hypothetical protein
MFDRVFNFGEFACGFTIYALASPNVILIFLFIGKVDASYALPSSPA